jgi:hypothetical protein
MLEELAPARIALLRGPAIDQSWQSKKENAE